LLEDKENIITKPTGENCDRETEETKTVIQKFWKK
jgi:hypothetical protein